MFQVGQKVRCTARGDWSKTRTRWPEYAKSVPVRGGIYTVREITSRWDGTGILLVEIVNPKVPEYDLEICWALYANDGHPEFLPITETDISVFKEILNKIPMKEKEAV